MYLPDFVNINRKFKRDGISYEFGKRLVDPIVDLKGGYLQIKHRLNGVEAHLDGDVINLAEMIDCPEFEMKGNQILSPITVVKTNKNKMYFTIIGSNEYDTVEKMVSEKESFIDDKLRLSKGLQCSIKFHPQVWIENGDLKLIRENSISYIGYSCNDTIKSALRSDEGLDVIYIGTFVNKSVSLSRIYYNDPVKLNQYDSSKNLLFFVPEHNCYLLMPISKRKDILIEKASKYYKDIELGSLSVKSVDKILFKIAIASFRKEMERYLADTDYFFNEYINFFCEETRDLYVKELERDVLKNVKYIKP